MAKSNVVALSDPTNGGLDAIRVSQPFSVAVTVVGSADLLMHRWNCEAVETKAKAAKNSAAKKSDDVNSYVYRNDAGELCLPGEYLRQSIIHAAKYRQDPRSPRKSAMDMYKAGIVVETMLAPIVTARGVATEWDYLDTRRCVVQRNGINRTRPAMRAGWKCDFQVMVLLPEYIARADLNDVIQTAGRLVGLGDFRPTYGRFQIYKFE